MLVRIVDDNDTNVLLFEHIVRRLDASLEIECFLDPVEALAACALRIPDLVLVDYMMPGLDGHEFVERFRAMPGGKDIPVVMVTAANDRSVKYRALELGATDFLSKPIDPSEVKARLINLLALRRCQIRLEERNKWLADEVLQATKVIIDREEELIMRLSRAAEFRDPETGAHILRMAHFSRLIAEALDLPTERSDLIFRAAPMHDIGKLGIPDGILLKPGKLDDHEFEVMRRHPIIGQSILAESSSHLIQLGAEIAISHHERFDGTGYPYGRSGENIPLPGRIVAVADVFDALTSERSYKKAWSMEDARAMLENNRGRHFDPVCVDAFLSRWDDIVAIRQRIFDDNEALALVTPL